MVLWNNSRKRTNLWNNGREKIAPWIIFIIILTAAKGADFSQNGGGPTHTMEQQTNNFHSRKISISDIVEIPPISIYQNMPGARGRPKSPWWSHFQTVDGRIVSSCYVLSLPYLIFVIFSPPIQFSAQFLSTQKRVNRDETIQAKNSVNCHKTDFTTKNRINFRFLHICHV